MRYLVLLHGDEAGGPQPGTPEWDADMAGYEAFEELAGGAIVAGEALQPSDTSRTIRHDGSGVRVTAGPFAEVVEALGGLYVLEAPTLDDVLELARRIPAAASGAIEIRPLAQWFDRADELPPAPAGVARYLATIHGRELDAEEVGSVAWDAGAAEHGRFVEAAGEAVVAGGAVHPTATATTLRVRDGELLVTDGPFSEAVEIVGGLYLLRGTEDGALDVARRIPVGEGGAVDVRPIMDLDG